MKKLLFLAFLALFFFSCKPDYNNKVIGRRVSTISCKFIPAADDKADIDSGFVNVDASHPGNPMICDSVYTIAFTTYENWNAGNKWLLFSGIAFLVISIGLFIRQTSSGDDKEVYVVALITCLMIGSALVVGFYYFNPYRDIRKRDYVHFIQQDGDLRNFPLDPAQAY